MWMLSLHFHDLLSSCLNLVSRSVSWRKAFFIFFDLTGCRISTHLCSKATSSSLASILEAKTQFRFTLSGMTLKSNFRLDCCC